MQSFSIPAECETRFLSHQSLIVERYKYLIVQDLQRTIMQFHATPSRLESRIAHIPNVHSATRFFVPSRKIIHKRKFRLFAAVVTDKSVPEGELDMLVNNA
jgi:hypothetical protein